MAHLWPRDTQNLELVLLLCYIFTIGQEDYHKQEQKTLHSPRRTFVSGLYGEAGKVAALWCRGSYSQTSYHADAGRWGRCEYHTCTERQTRHLISPKQLIHYPWIGFEFLKSLRWKIWHNFSLTKMQHAVCKCVCMHVCINLCMYVCVCVPSPGCETLQLSENTHSVSCSLDHICLRKNILGKCLKQ